MFSCCAQAVRVNRKQRKPTKHYKTLEKEMNIRTCKENLSGFALVRSDVGLFMLTPTWS